MTQGKAWQFFLRVCQKPLGTEQKLRVPSGIRENITCKEFSILIFIWRTSLLFSIVLCSAGKEWIDSFLSNCIPRYLLWISLVASILFFQPLLLHSLLDMGLTQTFSCRSVSRLPVNMLLKLADSTGTVLMLFETCIMMGRGEAVPYHACTVRDGRGSYSRL